MKRTLPHRVDDALYALERTFVVCAMSLMVLMVFFDVLDRRLQSPESKIAGMLRALHIPAADAVAPWFGLVLLTVLFWFGLATLRRRRKGSGGLAPAVEPLVALAGTAVACGFGFIMLHRPSTDFYALVWIAIALSFTLAAARERKGRRQLKVVLAALSIPAGALALRAIVPEGYSWAKEVAMILLVWTGLIGASMAAHQGRHIDIDFGKKMFPKKLRVPIAVLANGVTFAFCALIVALGCVYVFGASGLYRLGGRFPHTGLPDWIVAFAIPWTFLTIGLRTVLTALRVARGNLDAKGSSPDAVSKQIGEH